MFDCARVVKAGDVRPRRRFSLPCGEPTSPFRRWASGNGEAALGHRSYRRPGSLVASDHDMFSKSGSPETPRAGPVSAWALGLKQLLSDPAGRAAFTAFLQSCVSRENIDFWTECERYRASASPELALAIWRRFLADDAPESVNVDNQSRQAAAQRLAEAPPDLFDKAQDHIYRLMNFNNYHRFIESKIYLECAQAEHEGKRCPYLPPDKGTKLEKSHSSAGEGRRGLFRIRKGSRPPAPAAPQPAAERRPSVQIPLERLCNIQLPGEVRSVQEAVEHLTVRQSIDSLLRNRGMRVRDYDVKIVGDAKPVELDGPMSALARRAIVVEPRVSLRLQVAGRRPLAVRARPDKTLAEVVSSALAYHDVRAPGVAVLRAAGRVPLDTQLKDLENERLHVQIIPEPSKTEDKPTNEAPAVNPSANRRASTTIRPCSTNHSSALSACGKQAAPSLNEITNRMFEELMEGKSELDEEPLNNSLKSETCGSEASCRAVTTRLRPGDPLGVALAASLTDTQRQRLPRADTSSPTSPSAAPAPVPAARSFTRPQPAVRTSLAKQTSPTSFNIPPDATPTTPTSLPASPIDPPPLPPKPRVQPTKPSNWGKVDESGLSRMVYLDQPTSSFV